MSRCRIGFPFPGDPDYEPGVFEGPPSGMEEQVQLLQDEPGRAIEFRPGAWGGLTDGFALIDATTGEAIEHWCYIAQSATWRAMQFLDEMVVNDPTTVFRHDPAGDRLARWEHSPHKTASDRYGGIAADLYRGRIDEQRQAAKGHLAANPRKAFGFNSLDGLEPQAIEIASYEAINLCSAIPGRSCCREKDEPVTELTPSPQLKRQKQGT